MRMPHVTAAMPSAWSVIVLQLTVSNCLHLPCYSTLLPLIILVNACRSMFVVHTLFGLGCKYVVRCRPP